MSTLQIGDRMKTYYEGVYKYSLPMRMPVIIRLDGKAFHSFTRRIKAKKPFDDLFIENMGKVATAVCNEASGAVLAYVQSDEISILLHNYKKLDSQAWFANEVQKIASVSAGIASATMSLAYQREAVFDSRVFVLPESEVVNYFIWRQQDATRNSINSLAQSLFSPKQLHNKNTSQLQDLMMEKGVNWDKLETHKKRGFCVIRSEIGLIQDNEIPIFTQNRKYIEDLLQVDGSGTRSQPVSVPQPTSNSTQ